MKVTRRINNQEISIRKSTTLDLYIDDEYVASSGCYDNLQSRVFELLLDKTPQTGRTTEKVMKLYFNIQILFAIANQEL